MKKLLAVLLALCVVGAFAFAEDPAPVSKVGGYLYAGANVYANDKTQSLAPSWLSSGNFADITLSYSNGTYGFSGTVEFENDAVNSAFRDYTLWVKPFDFMKVSAGKLRNGDYRLTSYVDGSGFNTRLANAEYGYMVQFYPIANLSIGMFNFVNKAGQDFTVKNFDFGASYKIDGIAKFVAAAKMNETSLATVYTDEYFFGVDVLAVKGLTAKLGLTLDTTANVGGAHNNEFTRIWATAGYTVAGIDCGLDAYYKLTADGSELFGKVNFAYAMDKFTPSVYFAYTGVTGYVANTTKADGTTALASPDTKQDGADIAFGAQLAVACGDGGTLYLGIDLDKDTSHSDADPKITWSIPVSVEISF